jgi:hypothetical protein
MLGTMIMPMMEELSHLRKRLFRFKIDFKVCFELFDILTVVFHISS